MLKDDNLRGWTQSAIDCYYLGCVCFKCPINDILESRCRMKQTVLGLVRKFGKPEKRFSNSQQVDY